MLRLIALLIAIAALSVGLSWLADRPGSIIINWQGYEIETSVFRAIVLLTLLVGLLFIAWSAIVQIWRSPALLGDLFNRRRQARGLEALSSGMIAIGAGDRATATRYAVQAGKSLPNEPLTQLLRAQAAQLAGDRPTARRIFEAMLGSPDTEQLGLRGLYLESEREGEREASRQFAERAIRLNPKLGWPVDALFEIQCKEHDWDGALDTLAIARKNQLVDRNVADRRRAVLLTARAQVMEDSNPDRAVALALEAHHLAHDLIPAAAIAGRLLAARGNTKRAAHVIERTWRKSPHPDLATAYAYARIGDSPSDRLQRAKRLAHLNAHSPETPIAIATAAIEAHDWDTARLQLASLGEERLTQRACTLMARIENEDKGDEGKVREWLARAVHAPRDPAWTADGVVSDHWAPVSPVTGALDAFEWRVPVEAVGVTDATALARRLDEMVRLGGKASGTELARNGAATEPVLGKAAESPAATAPPLRKTGKDVVDIEPATIRPADPAMAKPNGAAGSSGAGAPGAGKPPEAGIPTRPPDDPGI